MSDRTKRPTIADVAAYAGVGVATVDRVLTGRRKVREENARRVFEAASALGYHATPVIRYRLDQVAPRVTFGFVLPKKNQAYYRELSENLRTEVDNLREVRGSVIIRYAETQDPSEYSDLLEGMAGTADVIGASAVDHPAVGRAVESLSRADVPVFAMLNDFACEWRQGFIGIDSYRAGRQAGWLLSSIIRNPGTIAILVGGSLWRAHREREEGLRSFFHDHAPEFRLRDAVLNLETRQITRAMVQDLVQSQPDLRGIYITGGGVEGAIEALRDVSTPGKIRLVVHPVTDDIRAAVRAGLVTMVIGTPTADVARCAVAAMATAVTSPRTPARQPLLKPEILLPDNV